MYEYLTAEDSSRFSLVDVINKYAKIGWRAVGYTSFDTGAKAYYTALLERKLPDLKQESVHKDNISLTDNELITLARFMCVLKPDQLEDFKRQNPAEWETVKSLIEGGS